MYTDLLIAGFGGQGIQVTGQILVTAAMFDGKEVTFMPAYGAEVRGGTSHVTVVISDRYISSPLIPDPEAAIIMNRPSLDRYEGALKSQGLLIANSSLIDREIVREDLRLATIPATEIANELGNPRVVTMVALGAYVAATEITTLDSLRKAILTVLPPERHHLEAVNCQALERGMAHYRQGRA